jgi:hypothetical protein
MFHMQAEVVPFGFSGEEPVKRIALWTTTVLVLAVTVAGFAPGSTPYSTPYDLPFVERPSEEDAGAFDGLLTLAETLPPSSTLNVLWMHGMCTHRPDWIEERLGKLAAALGSAPKTVSVRPVGRHGASLRTERIVVRSATIDVMFLSWSPITSPSKAALSYDHSVERGGEFPYARAFLNRELKHGLINDCMTDVVVYGGPNGAAIRLAAEEALCNALGGSYVGTDCSVPHGEAPGALAFIAESLGSKLLFDSVLEVWADAENGRDKAMFERVAKGLAGTRMIYLMANQLPLLDVAGPAIGFVNGAPGPQRRTSGSIARDVFDLLSRLRGWTPSGAAPMTVVAFSDPNDLLSYRVVPNHLAGSLREFRIVNVIVSNDTTYFNYVERPDKAHCGYARNPHVLSMIARGYQAGKSLPPIPGLQIGCPDFISMPDSRL